jgi:uncharacterized protein (TIGR02147 family)
MFFEQEDYRTILKTQWVTKSERGLPRSLRSFSQKIGVSSSFLSEVLNRKKSLSVELAFKIALNLNLTDQETQYFCLLVQLDQEKDPIYREVLGKRLKAIKPEHDVFDLSLDLFRVISDWYHYAILELTYIPDFQARPEYIASNLGISLMEAELALDRLTSLELLERDRLGRFRKAHSQLVVQSRVPNAALKSHHLQFLQKCIDSIESQTPKERMSATDVFPIDSKYISKIDRLSREFSSKVLKLSKQSRTKDSVYALAVHCFRVTHPNKKEVQP